ncbi:hypothetical protein DPEC_G00039210 [Dallia pectoralis]|uniref:Uncharacterized protein n=1 Tax=Dallia pectoralis TaxID=75939 RepID=A0ACC2HEA3_DALPE|nr:hypothetical protein DPEC_G00039210 [Dallia pectoralis]
MLSGVDEPQASVPSALIRWNIQDAYQMPFTRWIAVPFLTTYTVSIMGRVPKEAQQGASNLVEWLGVDRLPLVLLSRRRNPCPERPPLANDMQENVNQPTSLSQFLREKYLAEARAHERHSEMSRFDSTQRVVYGPLEGKAEDPVGQEEPQSQFPDLSAFLSQEELDQSVNLACQAIGQEAREERLEAEAKTQLDLELKEPLHTYPTFLPERLPVIKTDESVGRASQWSVQENVLRADRQTTLPTIHDMEMKNNGAARENLEDFKRAGGKNTPAYGLETQSKKEFLNKAADFIEELSSLFKANSSKRIRPRSCKAHRSRANKCQADRGVYPPNADDRERPVLHQDFEIETLRADNPFSNQPPEVRGLTMESSLQQADLSIEDCRTNNPEYNDSGLLEADKENEPEDPVLVEVSPGVYTADPICEPPHFTQKLKSREVLEGSKVQLDCIVQGLPLPDVRWFCEGKELENCPDIQIVNNGELHSLIIAEAFEEDTGRYSCFASNFYGTDSTSAEIYIEGASSTDSDGEQHFEHVQHKKTQSQPGAPSLSLAVSAASLFEEDTLGSTEEHQQVAATLISLPSSQAAIVPVQVATTVLPVSELITGSPTLRVFTSSPAQESSAPPPVPVVSTQDLGPGDTLPAVGQVAAIQTSLAENLNGDSNTLEVYPQGLDGRPLMAAPVFTKSLQELLASESQLVVLECRVKGVPSPKVDWYREGTLIEDSPDFRILQKKPRSMGETEEICTLVIAEVFPEDSGTFTCTASNKYGTVSSIAKLRVKGNDNTNRSNAKTFRGSLTVETSSSNLSLPSLPAVTNSVKPYSNTIHLDSLSSSTLHLDPLSSSMQRQDPVSTSMQRQDPVSTNMPSLGPLSLGRSPRIGTCSSSTSRLDPLYLNTPHPGVATSSSGLLRPEVQSSGENHRTDEEDSSTVSQLPDPGIGEIPKVVWTPVQNTEKPPPVNLPDPPISSCLKPGVLVNQNGSRSSSKAGLRVHFKLPEDEMDLENEASSSMSNEELLANKGPPPVLAKPKLSIPAAFCRPFTTVQNTTTSALLRTTHSSLLDLTPMSQSFNYARPKEFIPVRTPLSPVISPSPTESPVPLLQELAAELHSSSGNLFSPQPRFFPTRVLKSPSSPSSFMSSPTSPTLLPAAFLNSVFTLPQQSPPQAASPTSSTSSPIQDHVAFLSSVLPSLHTAQATNSMGLPKSTHGLPQGSVKKLPPRPISDDELRSSQQNLLQGIEKKLRLNEDFMRGIQKPTTNEGKTASRVLGPNIPATVFNYDEEYKVSNFEQRLMSEIEFRLERTPVEESDDEVHHDEIPTGKCIAPIFDKKLKNFRAIEGVPMTFSCKVVGIPIPKVYWFKDGKQILRKDYRYRKIREGDGTCALHIEVTNSEDEGHYTVMAANPQGRISCSGHLIIQTAPLRNRTTQMIHSQRVRARIQEVEESEPTQERFFRPHFLQAPGDMVANEGKVCRLDCKVSGLPNPEMMWLINGTPIYPDYYHRMLVRENGMHSLVIDPLKQNDAGTYTCIASNKAGQSSFTLELKVVEKEMKQAPHFVEKLQNTGIAEGTPVRLECRVLGMPPPVIYWKKDNDTIPHTKDRVSLHQDATGYVCLLIQPTRKEDAGWYTVSAKNEAGIISCTARLDIYAQWHQHVPLPLKKTPRQGSRYAALTGQGLDIKSAFPTMDSSPILFSSSPVEAHLESEEL